MNKCTSHSRSMELIVSSPCVSIVMPVYNAEKYLHEAMESILNQTFTDFELLIINDGSTDKSEEVILLYDDPRIRYIKNETNLQIVKTLNKGIGLARGKYIARMDADDISLPERFDKQVRYMENNPDIDVCGTWLETFGDREHLQQYPTAHEQIKSELLFYSSMGHATVVMKKTIFDKYKYSDKYPKAEDYAFWVELINDFKFANLPISLYRYRQHQDQTCTQYNRTQLRSTYKALKKYFKNINIENIETIHYQIWQHKAVPLKKVEKWLVTLKNANKKSKYINTVVFNNTLFNQWWIMNNLQSNFNLHTLINFYTSSLYIPNKLSFVEHLKFIVKALVFYKRLET